jgi:hypothetical protein
MDINELLPWLFGSGTFLFVAASVIFSILCTAVPIGAVVWYLYNQNQKAKAVKQASLSWLPTMGTVIKSRVEVSGGENSTVSPKVIYTYEVRGQLFQCDQIRAGDKFWSVSSSQTAYQTIDKYPEGLDVTVYYNPANPAEATLER